ncbi:response regulator [Candidatus Saccharibacteria bacterium]|nr:response regulator [Candidatus Saccharibacteria bacterium]MCB9821374.1 response regulator [Candidatus Nomurabacteria bacterium]
MKLLVVDQSTVVRSFCSKTIEELGHRAYTASNSHLAIKLLDENIIDGCIINAHLPGNSGLELIYEMRSYKDLADLPITLMAEDKIARDFAIQLDKLKVVTIIQRSELSESTLARVVAVMQNRAA